MASEMLKEIERLLDYGRPPVRLIPLERAIMAAKPNFKEAADSILSAMMAALDSLDYEAAAAVRDEYERLRDALHDRSETRGEQQ